MRTKFKRLSLLRAAVGVGTLVPAFSHVASAATYTWDAGGGSNLSWTNGNNWAGIPTNTVPTSGSDVVFGTGGGTANMVETPAPTVGLRVNAPAASPATVGPALVLAILR